jgi:hypothetical protein
MYKWKSRYGESLVGLEGFYLNSAGKNDGPISLNLIFSRGIVGIRLSSSGEGVVASDSPRIETDLGEHGIIGKRDISEVLDIGSLLGGVLVSCESLMSKSFGDELGLRLQLTSGSLFILNLGDEMFVGAKMPDVD